MVVRCLPVRPSISRILRILSMGSLWSRLVGGSGDRCRRCGLMALRLSSSWHGICTTWVGSASKAESDLMLIGISLRRAGAGAAPYAVGQSGLFRVLVLFC